MRTTTPRFDARIDTIRLRLTLAQLTQPQWLRPRLPREWSTNGEPPFVKAIGAEGSRTSKKFDVRVQDVFSVPELCRQLDQIDGLVCVRVVDFDLAVDFLSPEPGKRVAMVGRMFNGISTIPTANVRLCDGTRTWSPTGGDTVDAALANGSTAYIGSQRPSGRGPQDPVSVRAYDKVVDGQPARGRFELCFRDAAVPFATIDELARFDFEALSSYYRFRRPVIAIRHFGRRPVNLRWRDLTAEKLAACRKSHRRIHALGTVADVELSRGIRLALRRLTRALRRPAGRAESASPGGAQVNLASKVSDRLVAQRAEKIPSLRLRSTRSPFCGTTRTSRTPKDSGNPSTPGANRGARSLSPMVFSAPLTSVAERPAHT